MRLLQSTYIIFYLLLQLNEHTINALLCNVQMYIINILTIFITSTADYNELTCQYDSDFTKGGVEKGSKCESKFCNGFKEYFFQIKRTTKIVQDELCTFALAHIVMHFHAIAILLYVLS